MPRTITHTTVALAAITTLALAFALTTTAKSTQYIRQLQK